MAIRPAREDDLPRIVEIYNAAIPTRRATADTEPVTVESSRHWFLAHTPARRPLLVGEAGGQILGWVGLEDFYGRPAYRYTAELSIYVAPEWQRHGHARQLLGEVMDRAPALGVRCLVAYVFAHNEPSLRLLRRFGFQPWGQLPDVADMDGREYSLCILGRRLARSGTDGPNAGGGRSRPRGAQDGSPGK